MTSRYSNKFPDCTFGNVDTCLGHWKIQSCLHKGFRFAIKPQSGFHERSLFVLDL